MTSYFTTFDGVTILASDSNGKPRVEVSFPDSGWDETTYVKPFGSADEAKAAAKGLADSVKAIKPRKWAGFMSPRLSAKEPELVEARAKTEAIVKAWAGDGCEVITVN